MATVTERLLTAEEFAQLPEPKDGSKQELLRGRIITMPPPGYRHGECCVNVCFVLKLYVKQTGFGSVTSNDAGFVSERDPDSVRGPDVAVWQKGKVPAGTVGYPEVPPDLAVEVLSPSQTSSRLNEKIHHYHRHGVKLLWVVDPEVRSVTVYHVPNKYQTLDETETLTGNDVLPGFSCPVKDLFS